MRVAYFAAGAGGMYCGSCLRDHRLAATLIEQGRDVVLIPLYTPLRSDEQEADTSAILYGGVNVYLQQQAGLFGKMPRFLTRLLDRPGLLRLAGRRASATKPAELGPMTVSILAGEDGRQVRELDQLIDVLRSLRPDIVHLPNLMLLGLAERIRAAVRVPVACSLAGEDIFLDALPEPYRTRSFELIARAADHVDAYIAPTRYYGEYATRHFRLPADRVHHIPLGIRATDFDGVDASIRTPDGLAPGSAGGSSGANTMDVAGRAGPPSGVVGSELVTIGYLARICPEKGLHMLVEAIVRLRQSGRRCRLRVAGYVGTADRPYLTKVRGRLAESGFAEDVDIVGEVTREEKIAFLRSIDLFSVPTTYAESKGLYLLEAMAAGVPVVAANHGAFPEWIEQTGGGLLHAPGDPAALADAIATLMDDAASRARYAEAGRRAVHTRFTDEVMAERTWSLFLQLVREWTKEGRQSIQR